MNQSWKSETKSSAEKELFHREQFIHKINWSPYTKLDI
jgi:hypothetical protein